MFSKLRFACLLSVATLAFAALGPRSTITIANKDISPDGSTRAASVVNDIHPGPVITAKKGEQFNVNVVNRLTDPQQVEGLSIHWHGFIQKGTNTMDGAAGITQCPIAPGDSFLYSFKADRAGSFWYHSHFGMQYCDGVRGALIVYDPKDPLRHLYDIDDESTIITVSEWYHVLSTSIFGVPLADSTLINGKGRFPGGPNAELAVVNVRRGKRYRFRVISISCDPNFVFSIDNHPLNIIEVDGVATRPHTVDSFQILSGQRYSAVLNANQPIGNYWVRALPSAGNLNISTNFENGINSAILRYKGATNEEPKSRKQSDPKKLLETDLHPLANPHAPGKPTPDGADITVNLTFGFDPSTFLFTVNNKRFIPPTVPVLLQIMSGARSAHELLPAGSVYTLERNKVVQINLPSGVIGGPHPFHLHGHVFNVVRSADSGRYNFLDPVQRDVVSIGETNGDHASIRFRTDNPGPWILHCHINFHLHEGLAIVFAEAPERPLFARHHKLDAWEKLCPRWDVLPDTVKEFADIVKGPHGEILNSSAT